MSKVTLTADDGETFTGTLPDNWSQVPLEAYARLSGAENLPDRVRATAALCGLPEAILVDDVKLYAAIRQAAPWLFRGELPQAPSAVAYFTYAGTTYRHVGNLAKINAGQFEALLTFLQASEGKPLACAPGLLAVLYCAEGEEQTPEVVRDAAQAFATLPMSIAWPALQDFMRSGAGAALHIRTVSALEEQVKVLLLTLEHATTGGRTTFWRKPLRALVRAWLSNARKTLSNS
jgi:hypothetical protein